MQTNRFAAALSTARDTPAAIAEVCQQTMQSLDSAPDLALVFVSLHHGPDYDQIAREIRRATGVRCLLGCTGEAIVGTGREIENQSAMSLWAARLPGAEIEPMQLRFAQSADGGAFVGWPDHLTGAWPADSLFLVLAEPFTFPADQLLMRLNEEQPGVPVVGGMASGGRMPGQNRLLFDDSPVDQGAVAVRLRGNFRVATVVSQGCRPIGKPFVITKANRNVIYELGGKPALTQLQEMYETLAREEQDLVQHGLHVGRVLNEYQERFGRGDFLVRNVVDADRESNAIAVAELVRAGQTIQFHVRDANTADEDLRELLKSARAASAAETQASLLFTCNGRGTRLFEQSDHDAKGVEQIFGAIPTAGFFAQGEIGPISGRNFLHGFTASVVLFG